MKPDDLYLGIGAQMDYNPRVRWRYRTWYWHLDGVTVYLLQTKTNGYLMVIKCGGGICRIIETDRRQLIWGQEPTDQMLVEFALRELASG